MFLRIDAIAGVCAEGLGALVSRREEDLWTLSSQEGENINIGRLK